MANTVHLFEDSSLKQVNGTANAIYDCYFSVYAMSK